VNGSCFAEPCSTRLKNPTRSFGLNDFLFHSVRTTVSLGEVCDSQMGIVASFTFVTIGEATVMIPRGVYL
jgi:hypothetical protein